jgi:hypothetical protein
MYQQNTTSKNKKYGHLLACPTLQRDGVTPPKFGAARAMTGMQRSSLF